MTYHGPPTGNRARLADGVAEPIVRLEAVRRRFGESLALDGISLTVGKGEILGIIGRSGAGKSTLIRCLNGLERPDAGRIEIAGQDITGLGEAALRPVRRRIGMIFQHFNLLAAKTVLDNVALPLKIEGKGRTDRLSRAADLLDLVGLADKRDAYPAQLSGGQKQRVGIARALAAHPSLLLSDEATSALDPETTQSILALLQRINRELGLTVILITHEMDVIRSIADRVAVIDQGRIVEDGPVWSVFSKPQAEITRRLLVGFLPELPPRFIESVAAGTRLIQVDIAGSLDQGQLILANAHPAAAKPLPPFRIVHGGIDYMRGRPVGRFFLAVEPSASASVDLLLHDLRTAGARAETIDP